MTEEAWCASAKLCGRIGSSWLWFSICWRWHCEMDFSSARYRGCGNVRHFHGADSQHEKACLKSRCANLCAGRCSAHLYVSMCLSLQCPPEGGLYKSARKLRCGIDSVAVERNAVLH